MKLALPVEGEGVKMDTSCCLMKEEILEDVKLVPPEHVQHNKTLHVIKKGPCGEVPGKFY